MTDEEKYRMLEIMKNMGMSEQDPSQRSTAESLMLWEDDGNRHRNYNTEDKAESILRSNMIRNSIYEQAQQPELNRFEKLKRILQQQSILSPDDMSEIDTKLINKRFPR